MNAESKKSESPLGRETSAESRTIRKSSQMNEAPEAGEYATSTQTSVTSSKTDGLGTELIRRWPHHSPRRSRPGKLVSGRTKRQRPARVVPGVSRCLSRSCGRSLFGRDFGDRRGVGRRLAGRVGRAGDRERRGGAVAVEVAARDAGERGGARVGVLVLVVLGLVHREMEAVPAERPVVGRRLIL